MLKINLRHLHLFVFFFTILTLTGCGWFQQSYIDPNKVDTANLEELENLKVSLRPHSSESPTLNNLRVNSLKDNALSIGAQGGLSWASSQINVKLQSDRKYLDSIFNFYALVLNHGVIPPVLETGDNSLNLADPNTIRVADRTYKIVKQARFATTPPNWREYLWLDYSKPTLPNRVLLPKSFDEQRIWREGVKAGWVKGIEQAYSIFQQNLARLKRDYQGMLIYRKLLDEKMISPPYVARTELGITGNGEDMRVNDQVLRIVEHPKLQTNAKHWQAVVVKRHE